MNFRDYKDRVEQGLTSVTILNALLVGFTVLGMLVGGAIVYYATCGAP